MNYIIVFKIICLWTLRTGDAYYFQPITEPLGAFLSNLGEAYVSHSSWRLLYYYDLQDFYKNIESYKDCLKKMGQICDHLEELGESSQCLSLVLKHQEFLKDINIDVEYLDSIQKDDIMENKRRKRESPLGFMTTYVFKPVFGIMDEDDAQEMVQKINNLAENQETHHTLFEQNLSIIRRTIETTNSSLTSFQNSMNELNTFVNTSIKQIQEMETEIKLHISFSYISDIATNIKIEYFKAIETIKKIIRNKLIGEYAEIMTYKRLIEDINTVALDLDDTRVMLLAKPRELQQSISILGTIRENKLLIELMVPMVDRNTYNLKKIIPLPMHNGNTTLVLNIENENYLIQNATKTFIPLKNVDLDSCREISSKKILCYPTREAHFVDESICESNILFGQKNEKLVQTCSYRNIENKNWIIGLDENRYFVSPYKSMYMKENCLHEIPKVSHIDVVGIMELNLNCEMVTDNLKIFPKFIKTRAKIHDLPVANRTQGIKIMNLTNIPSRLDKLPPQPQTVYMNYNEKFGELLNDTKKAEKTLNETKLVHKIERNMLRNGIICVFVFIIICLLTKCAMKLLYKKICN